MRTRALALVAALAASCAASDSPRTIDTVVDSAIGPVDRPVLLDDSWVMAVAYEGDVRVNGVACGELVEAAPGDEIVSVDRRGRLRIHARSGDGFVTELLPVSLRVSGGGSAEDAVGELVQVAIGDLDPDAPGDEIVAVGMARGSEDDGGPGMVRYLARTGPDGGFEEQRFLTGGLVHAIAIGDLMPERPGNEFVFAGFFGEAMIGYAAEGDGRLLVDSVEAPHTGNAKAACVMGDGFVLACDDGTTHRFRLGGGMWLLEEPRQHGAPLARIASYGDDGYLLCDNAGKLRLLWITAGGTKTHIAELDERTQRLRGAVLADLDPRTAGIEAATAGYDGEISVITLRPDAAGDALWTHDTDIARDTAKIHHLTSGRIDGFGTCLVSCGYSGDVLVVAHASGAGS